MRKMLLAAAASIAAIALPASAAQAQATIGVGIPSAKPSTMATPPSVDLGFGHFRGGRHRDGDRHDRRDRRRHRDRDTVLFAGPWLGDGDWDGGRAWEPESYNDWWHERPWRAYPRWMSNNDKCQRLWWSGGGWRC